MGEVFWRTYLGWWRVMVLMLVGLGAPVFGRGIFDDDWTPEPAPANVRPPAISVGPSNVPAPAVERHAVPSVEEQAKSRALLNSVYADALKDRTAAGRRKLMGTLSTELPKIKDAPSDEFLMLIGILNAAKEAADLPVILRTVDRLAERFEVNALAVKVRVTLLTPLKAETPAACDENVAGGLRLLNELLAANDYASAARVAAALRPAAVTNAAMAAMVQKRIGEIELARLAYERVRPQVEQLEKTPDNAAACTAVGSYYCFQLNRWPEGLALLAKGSDADLKKRAAQELEANVSVDDLLAVADDWWSASEKQPEAIRGRFRSHASSLYQANLASTTGLRHEMLNKRIAEVSGTESAGTPLVKSEVARLTSRWEEPSRPSAGRAVLEVEPKPIKGERTWKATAAGATLKGTIQVGNSDRNHGGDWYGGKLSVEAGYSLEGGTFVLSGGSLELNGKPDQPVHFKNVNIVCEYTANFKARNAVLDHCTFSKGGNFFWPDGYSAKFEMDGCVLHETKFASIIRMDYGLKIHKCSFVDCELGQRHWGYQNNETINDDGAGLVRHGWSDIGECDFYRCRLALSAIWMFQKCNLFLCKIADPETFNSKTPLSCEIGLMPEDFELLDELRKKTTSPGAGKLTYRGVPELYSRK